MKKCTNFDLSNNLLTKRVLIINIFSEKMVFLLQWSEDDEAAN